VQRGAQIENSWKIPPKVHGLSLRGQLLEPTLEVMAFGSSVKEGTKVFNLMF